MMFRNAFVITTCFVVILFWNAEALVGYDCGILSGNITRISLKDLGECNIPLPNVVEKQVMLQLLQIRDYNTIYVQTCKVEIKRVVMRCGFIADHAVSNGFAEYFFEATREQCKHLHERGRIQIGMVSLQGYRPNTTDSRTVTFAGILNNDGSCEGETYSDAFGTWQRATVQGIVTVTLRDYLAPISVKEEKIQLLGSMCSTKRQYCGMSDGGFAYWDSLPNGECDYKSYQVLFQGMGMRLEDGSEHNMRTVYTVEHSDVTFALTKGETRRVCGYEIYSTEHPRLFILEYAKGGFFMHETPVNSKDIDLLAYVNSKFIYVEKHFKRQFENLYFDVMQKRCYLERKVLGNAQAIASIRPDEFAYSYMSAEGYMALLTGEVVQIVKCTPIAVRLRHTETCYQELLVEGNNQTYFLTPKTRILKKRGTQISCNPVTPSMFEIDGKWYKFLPNPVETSAPQQLTPLSRPTWEYHSLDHLANAGIYSEKDLKKFRENILFPLDRYGVLDTIARSSLGDAVNTEGITIENLLDVKKLAKGVWDDMWARFSIFGTYSAGVLGIYFVIKIIKIFIDTAFHLLALHSVFGWSFVLLTAIWDSLANLILHIKTPPTKNLTKDRGSTGFDEIPLHEPAPLASLSEANSRKDHSSDHPLNPSADVEGQRTFGLQG